MKKYFIYIIFILITSCTNKEKMEIIYYGTEEFKEFEKTAKFSKEKAWQLQIKYLTENKKNKNGGTLYFILNENYIFSDYAKLKLNQATLRGVSVNAKTGEVKFNNSDKMITNLKSIGWRGKE